MKTATKRPPAFKFNLGSDAYERLIAIREQTGLPIAAFLRFAIEQKLARPELMRVGLKIPKLGEREFGIDLSPSLKKRIEDRADEAGIGISAWLRIAVWEKLTA